MFCPARWDDKTRAVHIGPGEHIKLGRMNMVNAKDFDFCSSQGMALPNNQAPSGAMVRLSYSE